MCLSMVWRPTRSTRTDTRFPYTTLLRSYEHKSKLSKAELQLENQIGNVNPYDDQIENLKNTSLAEVDYDSLNDMVKLKEHQEFRSEEHTSELQSQMRSTYAVSG